MRRQLEGLLERLYERHPRWALLGLPLDLVLDETRPRPPEPPRYGLAEPDRDAIARELRARHDAIRSLPFEDLRERVPSEQRHPISLPNGLVVHIEILELGWDSDEVLVEMNVDLRDPIANVWLGPGPRFAVRRDASGDPDDGEWEAWWR